ncbi:MAG: CocE/NonD family hydrolase, partial [Rhodospirillaceae bacterium]|nr:CocE/NonD family hydrolase [Rhodospirillaceae bacterium]
MKIPLRDGVELNATIYLPKGQAAPAPCIVTLTPYIGQSYHDRGVYFAAHGLPFLTVDVRGRGNSGGEFRPLIQEAKDGHDVVEWMARQSWCNGKVSMWGGSYAGYNQWATAKEAPPHLATIVPVASPYPGYDFPTRNNMAAPYLMQWLTFTSGKTSQANIFGDPFFWSSLWRERFEKGEAFSTLPKVFGGDQKILQEWISHPEVDAWYDSYAPTPEQFRALDMPILTITGSYDGDQPGAMGGGGLGGHLGSCRHAHAAARGGRRQIRPRKPARPAEAPSRLVCMDDGGRSQAGLPQKARRLLCDGCREMALRGHARSDHRRAARLLSRFNRQRDAGHGVRR